MVNKVEDKPEDKPVAPEGSSDKEKSKTEAGAGEPATTATTSSPEKKVKDAKETKDTAQAEPKKVMRAVILTSFGGLKGVKLAERPQPAEPKETQVTVKVNISGVNFQDLMIRLGVVDNPPQPKTPFILGTELIGTVTAVGSQVTKVKVDDLIFGLPENGGAWAEFVNLDEKLVWKISKPEIGLEKLSSTLAYLIADLLLERSGVISGANVLVHSAGGAVGLALKDLAKIKGINVLGIASQAKHEKLDGFSHLIPRGQDYVSEVKKLYPEGLNAVFDSQGGDDCGRGVSLLAPWGNYVLYGSANIVTGETKSFLSLAKSWWTQVEKISPMKLYEENKGIAGLHLRHLIKACPVRIQASLDKIWELMANGTINPVQDLTFHFEQVTQAMQRMHERKNVGKVLIVPEVAPPANTPPATTPTTSSSQSQSQDATEADVKEADTTKAEVPTSASTDGNNEAATVEATNNEQSPPSAEK